MNLLQIYFNKELIGLAVVIAIATPFCLYYKKYLKKPKNSKLYEQKYREFYKLNNKKLC